VTIGEVAVGCVIVLLLIAGVYLLLTRSSAIPLWRRKLAMGTFVFALISAAVAVYAWIAYLPFAQVGLPTNASYTEWLTHVGPVRMNDLATMLNSLTYVTGGIVLVSLVLTALVVEQAIQPIGERIFRW
jgi:hypothetical protein